MGELASGCGKDGQTQKGMKLGGQNGGVGKEHRRPLDTVYSRPPNLKTGPNSPILQCFLATQLFLCDSPPLL